MIKGVGHRQAIAEQVVGIGCCVAARVELGFHAIEFVIGLGHGRARTIGRLFAGRASRCFGIGIDD